MASHTDEKREMFVMQPESPAAAVVAGAAEDHREIMRTIDAMPKKERSGLREVARSATGLLRRIEMLSRMPVSGRTNNAGARELIENEIRMLEAQANPLDTERSELRVRRLAFLKRQHRALADAPDGADGVTDRLDECAIALHNMRLDVARLRAGTQSLEQVTLLAERAAALAKEVDGALRSGASTGAPSIPRVPEQGPGPA
jgi:serine/threonine-protein kinase